MLLVCFCFLLAAAAGDTEQRVVQATVFGPGAATNTARSGAARVEALAVIGVFSGLEDDHFARRTAQRSTWFPPSEGAAT